MPFTLAHPIYVYPLKRVAPKYINLTGLILGSMSPDFEYFLRLEPYQTIGHSLLGLFLQAIPISIFFALMFHYVIKAPIAEHLPSTLRLNQRAYSLLSGWGLGSTREWFIFVISVIIGFASHMMIDAFTHANGLFVVHASLLREVFLYNLPVYKMLQYGLSVFGLLLTVGLIVFRLYKSTPDRNCRDVSHKKKCLFWMISLFVSVMVTVIKCLISASENLIGTIVVAPISGFILGVVLASIAVKLRFIRD